MWVFCRHWTSSVTYFFAGVEGGGVVRTFYSNELNCLRERHKEKIGPS